MKRLAKLAFLAAAFALSARAQLELLLPSGAPAPPVYDLGQVSGAEPATARFLLRNSSSAPATLTTLNVAGVGFTLSAPAIPLGIPAQSALDLTVTFQAAESGAYSAAFHAGSAVILLTATVLPSLTYRADSPNGLVPLTALDFGSLTRGTAAQRRVTLRNETTTILTIPPISVQGDGFSLAAPPPSGQSLVPQQGGEFLVEFHPQSAGPFTGTLLIGARAVPLTGTALPPPLPKPALSIDLQPASSARQGVLVIRFDAPAQTAGTGTAALDFRGPSDPAIAFATGGRTATFAVAPGDTQALVPFQTGTTAGTLTFTVQLGQSSDQSSVTIPAAPPAVTAAQALRSPGTLEIRITGFDNTRTLASLLFTFFDASGKSVASLPIDAAADFAKFFAVSDLGGVFFLRAVFPVTGDASQIAACEVSLKNVAGATLRRIVF